MGRVTCRVTCTWWLLQQALEMAWLALGGPILAMVTQMHVARQCYYHLLGASFLSVKVVWAQNRCFLAENTDYCKSVNEWVCG